MFQFTKDRGLGYHHTMQLAAQRALWSGSVSLEVGMGNRV